MLLNPLLLVPGNEVRDVEITIDVPAGVSSCTLSWTSWMYGSRDGEWDHLYVNDDEVWSGWRDNGGWRDVDAPQNAGQDYGGIWVTDQSVQVSCSGQLRVRFHSDIDEGRRNEGWAFNNFNVAGA